MAVASTIIAGIGLAVSAAGVGVGYNASQKQAAATEKAEKIREKQMNLQAQRQTRQEIRNQIVARSVALNNAVAQGAEAGSALQGGYGQIGGQTGVNLTGISQNRQLGQQMFSANADYAAAGTQAFLGQGLSSLGQGFINNSETIARISKYAGGGTPVPPWLTRGLY